MGVSGSVSPSALNWQGWLVGLVTLAGLLVFAPLGLYVWASGGGDSARPAVEYVRVTDCRIDPSSRRVVARVEATGHPDTRGEYIATVEFRDAPPPTQGARAAQTLLKIPGVSPSTTEQSEAVGPVWPPATTPWCGITTATFTPTPPH